jgi:hypothetical protein
MGDDYLGFDAIAPRLLLREISAILFIDGPVPDNLTIILRRTGLEAHREQMVEAWPSVRKLLVPFSEDSSKLTYPPIQRAIDEARGLVHDIAAGAKRGGLKTQAKRRAALKAASTPCSADVDMRLRKHGEHVAETLDLTTTLAECFDRIAARYPYKYADQLAKQEFQNAVGRGDITTATILEVEEGLERYLASDTWHQEEGRYIPKLSNFIQERRWRENPRGWSGGKAAVCIN